MRMKRLWKKLKGGDGRKNDNRAPVRAALAEAPGGRQRQQETREPEQHRVVASEALAVCSAAPQAEVTARSPLTPCDTSGRAAAPGGEPDICSLREGFGRPGASADKPPSPPPPPPPEHTSPDTAASASPVVPLQAPPQSPGSSPEAPSQEGGPERGAAPGVHGESVLPQEGGAGPWVVPVGRTSRWQVDVSRLSGARRALREAPSGSADSTQSLSDAMPCSPREASLEVTSPSLEDREQPALDPPVCLPGPPACPADPSSCNGGLCDPAVAALESGPAERSLEALLQAAVRAREESASRAAVALAEAAHLDVVLHAARVYTGMQDLSAGGPPQATLQALLTLREEGHGREDPGQLGADRPAWAAAWVEAALSGGLASLPPPAPGARLALPNGAARTGVASSSSPALAARSPLSGGGRHGTWRAGAVVTTPAPSLLQARVEGQSPARRRGEATGAGPAGDEGQRDKGDRGRASVLSGAGEAWEGSAAQEWQQGSSKRAAYPAAPAEHTEEGLSTAGNRPEDGGSCPEAVGPALEARVREGADRQLVALVEQVLEEAREGPPGTGGSSSRRAATELLALLHRAHKQLAEVEAASADHAMRAKAATARDEIVKHITAYVSS